MSELSNNTPRSFPVWLPWLIFLTGILFYCFAYLLRVYPGVFEHGLRHNLHLTASGFGILTSCYYFAYAPMQIPVGVCIDKMGPRKSILIACLIATLGAFLFAESHLLSVALLGRFLVGFGSAFSYVTALKLATIWLPRRYFATATGLVTSLGMVAAIFTDNYLTELVKHIAFKQALLFPVSVGVVLFIFLLLVMREKPKPATQADTTGNDQEVYAVSFRQLGFYLKKIFHNPQMWIIGLVGAFLYLPSSMFLDTWAIPYLKIAHHLSKQEAALGVSLMFAGWITASFMAGVLSDIFGNRKILLLLASFFGAIFSILVLYLPGLSVTSVFVLLFMLGFSCGPHPLCFSLSKENCSNKISGTAIAFTNFIIMMGGFIFQPFVGKLLDIARHGATLHGLPLYTAHDFKFALAIMPIALLLSFTLTFFIKDTCQTVSQQDKPSTATIHFSDSHRLTN